MSTGWPVQNIKAILLLFIPHKEAGGTPILGQDYEALNSKLHYTGQKVTKNRENVYLN
jgi:hypothetical protein